MREHAGKALLAALAGAVIGWAGNALTLAGRVTAIEASLIRIETRLDLHSPIPAVLQDVARASTAPAVSPGPPGPDRQR